MRAIHPLDDSLKAIGIDSKGNKKDFRIMFNYELHCYDEDLVSIEIPEGVKDIWCYNNLLTELKLPKGVEYLNCHTNLLTELNIPNSIEYLRCDRNVLGLDKVNLKCDIILK